MEVGDIDAERALLASVWLSDDREMVLRLEKHDFVDIFNQWLFSKLEAVVKADEPLDMVAVLRRVRAPGGMDALPEFARESVPADIAELLRDCPTTAHKEYYFSVVRVERARRSSVLLADSMKEKLTTKSLDPMRVLKWVEESVQRIKNRAGGAS